MGGLGCVLTVSRIRAFPQRRSCFKKGEAGTAKKKRYRRRGLTYIAKVMAAQKGSLSISSRP